MINDVQKVRCMKQSGKKKEQVSLAHFKHQTLLDYRSLLVFITGVKVLQYNCCVVC